MHRYLRKRNRLFLGVCVALVVTFALAAVAAAQVSNSSAAPKPVKGGTIVVAMTAEPTTLSTAFSTAYEPSQVGQMLFNGLVNITNTSKIVPELATSWTISKDGLHYRFNLRKAKWSDGKPFTSADVAYSLMNVNVKYSPLFSRAAPYLTSVSTPNPRTAVINLSKPYGALLISLGNIFGGSILPKHIFEGTDPTKNPGALTNPVGTGPFVLQSWDRGQQMTFVRNPNYYGAPAKPYLDKIIVRIIPSASSINLALQAGEVNYVIANYFPGDLYSQVMSNPKLKLVNSPIPPSDRIVFFQTRGDHVTSNVAVRRALYQAIDRKFILRTVYRQIGDVGTAMWNPVIRWSHNPSVNLMKKYPYDPTAAGKALDAAGYPLKGGSRFSAKLIVSGAQPPLVQVAQIIKQQLAAVGVNVNISLWTPTMGNDVLFGTVAQGPDWDLYLEGYTTYGDPQLGIMRRFVSSSIGTAFGDASGWSTPQVDALAAQAASASTQDARGVIYKKIEPIVADAIPNAPFYRVVIYDVASKNLMNLWNLMNMPDWANGYLAK